MSESISSLGLPSFERHPALLAFSNAAALQAVKLSLLSIEPVGWTPQAREAFEAAQEPMAKALDKELAARLALSEWMSSPAREASVKALARLMALPARDALGRWGVFSPLNGTLLRLDEKSASPSWGRQRGLGAAGAESFKPLRETISTNEAASAYPAAFEAERAASVGSRPFETDSQKALREVAKEHLSRVLGPAHSLGAEPLPAPAVSNDWPGFSRSPDQPNMKSLKRARWDGPKLRSGPFAKAFKRLMSQSGLSPLGWEAVASVDSDEIDPAWVKAAKKLDRGGGSERSEILRLIRQAFDQALRADLPEEGEGVACLLLASFGPAVDREMASKGERLYQMWWGEEPFGFKLVGPKRGALKKIDAWSDVAYELKNAHNGWADPVEPERSGLADISNRSVGSALESLEEKRRLIEAQTKLGLAADSLAIEALAEAAGTESHWLKLAGLPGAAKALLAASSREFIAAHGVALGLEEARALESAADSLESAIGMMSAMSARASCRSIEQERHSLNVFLSRVGFDAKVRADFERTPWSREFARCVQGAVQLSVQKAAGEARGQEGGDWSERSCVAILCGLVAVSKQTPAGLNFPLSEGQRDQLSQAMITHVKEEVLPFKSAMVSIDLTGIRRGVSRPPEEMLDFFIQHARETTRQAELLGLDFLSRELNIPALSTIETAQWTRKADARHVSAHASLTMVVGHPLPLRWEGTGQWADWMDEHGAAQEKRLDELQEKVQGLEARIASTRAARKERDHEGLSRHSLTRQDAYGWGGFYGFDMSMSNAHFEQMMRFVDPNMRAQLLTMRYESLAKLSGDNSGVSVSLDPEAKTLLSQEGFEGQMALLAMRLNRQPQLREGVDARSQANAWLGEGKALARELMGLTEGAWRGVRQSPLAAACALSQCVRANENGGLYHYRSDHRNSGVGLASAKRAGDFFNVASASGLSMEAAALAGLAAKTCFSASEVNLSEVSWSRLSESCQHGVGAEAIFRGLEREMVAARALRPRWIAAVIERAGQLIAQQDPERFKAGNLLDLSLAAQGESPLGGGGLSVKTALEQELRDMEDWAKDWAGRFYGQLPAKLTWKTLADGSAQWHADAMERKFPLSSWDAIGVEWKGSGDVQGLEAHELCSSNLLSAEGSAMRHCVGSYSRYCREGSARIISIKEDGRRLSTLQLSTASTLASREGVLPIGEHQWVISQHRGVCNSEPSEKAKKAANQIVAAACQASLSAVERARVALSESKAVDLSQETRKAQDDFSAWDETPKLPPEPGSLGEKLKARGLHWEAEAIKQTHKQTQLAKKSEKKKNASR